MASEQYAIVQQDSPHKWGNHSHLYYRTFSGGCQAVIAGRLDAGGLWRGVRVWHAGDARQTGGSGQDTIMSKDADGCQREKKKGEPAGGVREIPARAAGGIPGQRAGAFGASEAGTTVSRHRRHPPTVTAETRTTDAHRNQQACGRETPGKPQACPVPYSRQQQNQRQSERSCNHVRAEQQEGSPV